MSFFVSAGLVGLAVVGFLWLRDKQIDRGLDAALNRAHLEARMTLSPEGLSKLNAQLVELAAAGRQAHREGLDAKTASRMGKQAAIQSIATYLEIERMFPG